MYEGKYRDETKVGRQNNLQSKCRQKDQRERQRQKEIERERQENPVRRVYGRAPYTILSRSPPHPLLYTLFLFNVLPFLRRISRDYTQPPLIFTVDVYVAKTALYIKQFSYYRPLRLTMCYTQLENDLAETTVKISFYREKAGKRGKEKREPGQLVGKRKLLQQEINTVLARTTIRGDTDFHIPSSDIARSITFQGEFNQLTLTIGRQLIEFKVPLCNWSVN